MTADEEARLMAEFIRRGFAPEDLEGPALPPLEMRPSGQSVLTPIGPRLRTQTMAGADPGGRVIERMNRRVSPLETLGVMAEDVPNAVRGAAGVAGRFLNDLGESIYTPYGEASATFVDRVRAEQDAAARARAADEALWSPSNPNLITVTAKKPDRSLLERIPTLARNAVDAATPAAEMGGALVNAMTVAPGQRLVDRYVGIDAALARGDDAYADEIAQGSTADLVSLGLNSLGVGALARGALPAGVKSAATDDVLAAIPPAARLPEPVAPPQMESVGSIADELLRLGPQTADEAPGITAYRNALLAERNAEIAAENAAKTPQPTVGYGHANTLAARRALDEATARNGGIIAPVTPRYGENALSGPVSVRPPERIDPVNALRMRSSDRPDGGALFPQAGGASSEILAPIGNAANGAPQVGIGAAASNDIGAMARMREAFTREPRNLPSNPLSSGPPSSAFRANDTPLLPEVIEGGGARSAPRPPAALDVVTPASTPFDGMSLPMMDTPADRMASVRKLVDDFGGDEAAAIGWIEDIARVRARSPGGDELAAVSAADIEAIRSGAYLRPTSNVETVRPGNAAAGAPRSDILAPIQPGREAQAGQSVRGPRQGAEMANAPATPAEPRRAGRPPHPRQAEILKLAETMSVPQIAAETGVPTATIAPMLKRNGVTAAKAAGRGDAARDARILAVLDEMQPVRNTRADAGWKGKENSYRVIADRLQAEGFTNVTPSVISGVVKRAAPKAGAVEDVEAAAAALGMTPERYRALSARSPQNDVLGPIMLGGGAGAMALDAGSEAQAQERSLSTDNGYDGLRVIDPSPLPPGVSFAGDRVVEMMVDGEPQMVRLITYEDADGRIYERIGERTYPDGGIRIIGELSGGYVDRPGAGDDDEDPILAPNYAESEDLGPVGGAVGGVLGFIGGRYGARDPNLALTGGAALLASFLTRGRGGELLRAIERRQIAQGGRAFSRPVRVGADMVSSGVGGAAGGAVMQAAQGGDWEDGALLGGGLGLAYGGAHEAVTGNARRWDDVMRFADELERTPARPLRVQSARRDPWDNRTVEALSVDRRTYYVPEITTQTAQGPMVVVEPEARSVLAPIGRQMRERFETGVTPSGRRVPRDLEGREALMDEILNPVMSAREARAAEIANWSGTPSENARRALISDPVGRPSGTVVVNPGAGLPADRLARLAQDREAGVGVYAPAAIARRETADAEAAVRAAANNDVAAIRRRERALLGLPDGGGQVANPDDILAPIGASVPANRATAIAENPALEPLAPGRTVAGKTLKDRLETVDGSRGTVRPHFAASAGKGGYTPAQVQEAAQIVGAPTGGNRTTTVSAINAALKAMTPEARAAAVERLRDAGLLSVLAALGGAAVEDDYAPARLAM